MKKTDGVIIMKNVLIFIYMVFIFAACSNTIKGAIRFDQSTSQFDMCNATEWRRSLSLVAGGTSLDPSQGGTGRTTLTANNVILGNGTASVQLVAPSTAGNVLTSNGTTWVSRSPQYWSGYHDNTCDWTRSNAAFGNYTADASCALVSRNSSGISCSTNGSVLPALDCTVTAAGPFKVCAMIQNYNGTANAGTGLQLNDGTVALAEGGILNATGVSNLGQTTTLCGIAIASTTSLLVVIRGLTTSGSTSHITGLTGATSLDWTIEAL
jgi:hypothetical protein